MAEPQTSASSSESSDSETASQVSRAPSIADLRNAMKASEDAPAPRDVSEQKSLMLKGMIASVILIAGTLFPIAYAGTNTIDYHGAQQRIHWFMGTESSRRLQRDLAARNIAGVSDEEVN